MPPPTTEAPPAPERAGSPRRDPAWLLIAAGVLLVLRVVLGFVEERKASAPDRPAALEQEDRVHWRALPEGIAEARATGRPILYDFTAEWCPPCRMMQSEIFADSEEAKVLEQSLVPVRVLDRQREEGRNAPWVDSLQTRYRVNAFPTLVVTDAAGGAPTRIEGYLGKTITMSRIIQASAKLQMLKARAPAVR